MKSNRFANTRPESAVQAEFIDSMNSSTDNMLSRVFHLGQVIDSDDPKKLNRIRIRIPLLDDSYYINDKGELEDSSGDNKLPWCISANGRAIDTPENGSIVLVGLLDPQNANLGRVWFTALSAITNKDLFDETNLKEEKDDNWEDAEKNIGINYRNTPGKFANDKLKSKSKTTNYNVGLRGKNKNYLLFEKDKTSLVQNKGQGQKESKLELTEDVLLTGKLLDLLSTKSTKKEKPVFADHLIKVIQKQNSLLQQIVTTIMSAGTHINTVTGTPDAPNPAAATLMTAYTQIETQFADFKINGVSKNIKIN